MHIDQPTKNPGPAIWSTSLQIRSDDVDVTQSATLPSLFRYFLDAAWTHAESLGVGFSHLEQQQRVWVLSRILIQTRRRPRWGEIVTLSTWPRETKMLFAMRDFEIVDSAGLAVLGGTSAWLVLSRETRRPQRIELLSATIPATPRRATQRDAQKLCAQEGSSVVWSCSARPSDIDVNAHVNSARYLEWILDTCPLEFQRKHLPVELELNFLGETREGDTLDIVSRESPTGRWHHSIIKRAGAEVCRAQIQWKSIPPPQ